MSSAYLKVKIKSLAAEQTIIRHEERKYLASGRWCRSHDQQEARKPHYRTWAGLNTHRLNLRIEIRASLLAYGYLRGRAYRDLEGEPCWLKPPYCRTGPAWGRVRDLVWKYGPPCNPSALVSKDATDKAKNEMWKALIAWRDVPRTNQKAA